MSPAILMEQDIQNYWKAVFLDKQTYLYRNPKVQQYSPCLLMEKPKDDHTVLFVNLLEEFFLEDGKDLHLYLHIYADTK